MAQESASNPVDEIVLPMKKKPNRLKTWWSEGGTTVIFVTHSIPESIQLSDRVVVFTPRPGRIERVIDIDLPRPRSMAVREGAEFQHYVHELTSIFMGYGVLRER